MPTRIPVFFPGPPKYANRAEISADGSVRRQEPGDSHPRGFGIKQEYVRGEGLSGFLILRYPNSLHELQRLSGGKIGLLYHLSLGLLRLFMVSRQLLTVCRYTFNNSNSSENESFLSRVIIIHKKD